MDKVEQYRQNAENCRALAQETRFELVSRTLLEIAETWDRLVEDREWLDRTRRAG